MYTLWAAAPFQGQHLRGRGGVCSNVQGLLTWSRAVLRAEADPGNGGRPLGGISTLMGNQTPLADGCSYGMDWIRAHLPGVVGLLGENAALVGEHELPILGDKRSAMVTAYYHQSSAPGYSGAIYLFPGSTSAVVVLTNSMALGDAADWIVQAHISAPFDFRAQQPPSHDYRKLAEESRKRKVARFAYMMESSTRAGGSDSASLHHCHCNITRAYTHTTL